MTLAIAIEPAPLEVDADGVVRVGKTRVTLDTVVTAFLEGASAESNGWSLLHPHGRGKNLLNVRTIRLHIVPNLYLIRRRSSYYVY